MIVLKTKDLTDSQLVSAIPELQWKFWRTLILTSILLVCFTALYVANLSAGPLQTGPTYFAPLLALTLLLLGLPGIVLAFIYAKARKEAIAEYASRRGVIAG